jgi:hypothetical protein
MSAIIPPSLKPQDQGRITHLELRPIEGGADDASARASVARAAAVADRLWARMIAGYARYAANLAVWRKVLMEHGCGPRQADQPATLLAGYWTLVEDAVIAEQLARAELPRYAWMVSTAREAAEEGGAVRCLNHLLSMIVDPWRGSERPTIGRLLIDARSASGIEARTALRVHGIRLDLPAADKPVAGVWISNDNPMLKKLFADTEWADHGWPYELRRLDGAVAGKNPVRIGAAKGRATFVPMKHLPTEDDPPPPVVEEEAT